jgi:hypothetical protein
MTKNLQTALEILEDEGILEWHINPNDSSELHSTTLKFVKPAGKGREWIKESHASC